jgi:hypothetical protein
VLPKKSQLGSVWEAAQKAARSRKPPRRRRVRLDWRERLTYSPHGGCVRSRSGPSNALQDRTMPTFEDIKPRSRLCGLDPAGIADVVQVSRFGPDALNLVFRVSGRVGERLVYPQTGNRLVFLTNNFALDALTIAKFYKSRWQMELFFKWIKHTCASSVRRHLRKRRQIANLDRRLALRHGRNRQKRLALSASLYEILQVFSLTLFEKTPVNRLFDVVQSRKSLASDSNQLNLLN